MSSVSAIQSASDIQADYMKLLVAQLQNQDPMEPLDNNEMASQLAQFSQLQQLETMNSSFSKVLDFVEQTYATSLLSKNVSFLTETENGTFDAKNGTVDQVHNNVNGKIFLTIGDQTIGLEDVLSVKY
jgi:flagellar basal-body rod modification protein FlgD